jgi:hypothetical protein
MKQLLLALVALCACKQLDRSTKNACNTSADCVGLLNTCEGGVCTDVFSMLPSATGGTTGTTGKQCTESLECGAGKVCSDGRCGGFVERDYYQTTVAFRVMLCQTLSEVCGDSKMVAKYGSDAITNCEADDEAPFGLSLGPTFVTIDSWDPLNAARCVADTRSMLKSGLQKPVFSSLPEVCSSIGYSDSNFSCELGQIECFSDHICSKPANATGKWPCVASRAAFGETCFDRSTSGLSIPQRIKDTCTSDSYCDLRNNGTCKKRLAPGKACLQQYYDNDPVFDPCTSGYMCGDSGKCEPFVAQCPLDGR